MRNWNEEAMEDARDLINNFRDEIKEMLKTGEKVSDDWNNDYPNGDSFFHESYVDKWYSLTDAAELLDQLDEYEETDSGLWEGQSPRDAISTQAAFTYGNAVHFKAAEIIADINNIRDYEKRKIGDKTADTIINKALDNTGK